MDGNAIIQIVTEVEGTGGYGTVYLMNDGYLYVSHSVTQSAKYFRCKKYRVGCPGKVIFYSSGLNIQTSAHNHGADGVNEIINRYNRGLLLNEAMNSNTATLEDIVRDPRNANQIRALQLLAPSMHRLRERNLPPCQSLRDLSGILKNPDFAFLTRIHQFEEIIYQGSAESSDHSHVILFMSKHATDFLPIISSVSVLHISQPSSHQLCEMYIVAGLWETNVMPLAWIVSESNTSEALCAGFQLLKSKLTRSNFRHVISAADTAGNAFSQVFGVEVHPSLYDFINDIVTSEDTGLTQESLQNNSPLRQIVKLSCALALLPPDKIQIGIDFILEEALLCGQTIYNQAVPVFNLIEEKWFKIPKFSMCDNVDRTNYGSEELKYKVSAAISRSKVGFYSMIRNIIAFTLKADEDIHTARLGQTSVSRRGQVPLFAQTGILNLFKVVLHPPFTPKRAVKDFLETVATKIEHSL